MADLFFYGTLRDDGLREVVLGRPVAGQDAVLSGHEVCAAPGAAFPSIREGEGQALGVLMRDLTDADLARLDFYEGGFGYSLRDVVVQVDGVDCPAKVYFPDEPGEGEPWVLAEWQVPWGEVSRLAAQEVMDRFQGEGAEPVGRLMPFLRGRAWAQVIARDAAPQTVRTRMDISDVEVQGFAKGYDGFFRMRPFALRYRRFDGAWGDVLERECFVSYDVALVLPYDPVTDKVLLVEQLRFGPILRGDPAPWVLEPVAGLVDACETPEQAARREAEEEAGLALKRLIPLSKGYASPGYSTEFYHNFIGLCDLAQREAQSLNGLDVEHEDIRNHVMTFSDALALVDSGEINAVPLQMLLYGLAAKREALRAGV